jgi:hypothetical protein
MSFFGFRRDPRDDLEEQIARDMARDGVEEVVIVEETIIDDGYNESVVIVEETAYVEDSWWESSEYYED